MLFSLLDQFQIDPERAIITLLVLVGSLVAAFTVHEFSHAIVASRLGDETARHHGRVTLNPIKHLDPLGSILILTAGFGWAKPVPVNPAYLRPHARSGLAVVSAAGPVSNLLFAAAVAVVVNLDLLEPQVIGYTVFSGEFESIAAYAAGMLIVWNVTLAVFNFIPIAPLDGLKVALGLLPREASEALAKLERVGPLILIALVLFGQFTGTSIIWSVLGPVIRMFMALLLPGYAF